MKIRIWTALSLLPVLAGGAASAGQEPPAPAATMTVLARTSTTVTGQPVRLPEPVQVVISITELPAGSILPRHKHPWPRYAYVERGRLEVRYEAAGLVREVGPGEALIEAIDQWHEGRVIGSEPVRIIVVDHVPPGQTNIVRP